MPGCLAATRKRGWQPLVLTTSYSMWTCLQQQKQDTHITTSLSASPCSGSSRPDGSVIGSCRTWARRAVASLFRTLLLLHKSHYVYFADVTEARQTHHHLLVSITMFRLVPTRRLRDRVLPEMGEAAVASFFRTLWTLVVVHLEVSPCVKI